MKEQDRKKFPIQKNQIFLLNGAVVDLTAVPTSISAPSVIRDAEHIISQNQKENEEGK